MAGLSVSFESSVPLRSTKTKEESPHFSLSDNLGSGLPGAQRIKVGLRQSSGCEDGVLLLFFFPSFFQTSYVMRVRFSQAYCVPSGSLY